MMGAPDGNDFSAKCGNRSLSARHISKVTLFTKKKNITRITFYDEANEVIEDVK